MAEPFKTSTTGIKDYDNLWSDLLNINNGGDGNINQTTDTWVATTSAGAISGVAAVNQDDGTLRLYTLGRSSDSASATVRTALSLKNYAKFELAWGGTTTSSGSSTGTISIILTDAGANNSTILTFTCASLGNVASGGGKIRLTYDGTNIVFTNISQIAESGAGSVTNNATGTVNVSAWSNAYLSFSASSGGDSSVDTELRVFDIVSCDFFINSNKTQ